MTSSDVPATRTDFGVERRESADGPPTQIGRYRIVRQLGQGGMGTVWLAHDTQLDRPVALKVPQLRPEDGTTVRERFLREGRAAATLNHPNICPVHDVGFEDGVPYLAMAYIEGQPLSQRIQRLARAGNALSIPEIVSLVRRIALALEEAHARGVIHRDLKPANIMINERSEPVIMDFGLARRSQDVRLTQEGTFMGTPAYVSPEQLGGQVEAMGPGCDIYSLGVILYELLTGKLPFRGNLTTVLTKILHEHPAPPGRHRPDLDPVLDNLCLKALAKHPRDRFASMKEFADALTGFLDGRTGSVRALEETCVLPSQLVERGSSTKPVRSGSGVLAAVGVILLCVVGVTLWLVLRSGTPASEAERPAQEERRLPALPPPPFADVRGERGGPLRGDRPALPGLDDRSGEPKGPGQGLPRLRGPRSH